ncbi:MAG: Biopolymer transport protein ExbD/TolR [Verrucomicrobiota bacterium]|jgi:biopolymer transport protein ExbD
MKFHPTRRRRVEINVIPLIDILCMLLIFFIVTTTFKKKVANVDVTPPKSEKGNETVEDAKAPPELTMKSSKADEYAKIFDSDKFPIFLGDQPLNLDPKSDSFRADLAKALKDRGVKNVILNFDETTPISVFFKFFDACEDAGVPISVRTSKIGSATANP